MISSQSPASRSANSSRCGTPTSRAGTPSSSTVELDEDEQQEIAVEFNQQISKNAALKERRDLLDARLKGYRQEKLKRKLSIDSQLLSVAQDEVGIKKRLIEKLDNMDKQQANNMNKLTANMEQLTGSSAVEVHVDFIETMNIFMINFVLYIILFLYSYNLKTARVADMHEYLKLFSICKTHK